jgi:hypothetical protein
MKRFFVPLLITLSTVGLQSCGVPLTNSKPTLNVTPYLSDRDRNVLNDITFEVQKVLDTIDTLRSGGTLTFVNRLNYPGWKVEHKTGHVLFLKSHTFIAEKTFSIPRDCVKNVAGAELNVCHVKLVETLSKLAKAYGCDAKVEEIRYPLRERVILSCPY